MFPTYPNRFIVLLQTKDTSHLPPANDVSYASLGMIVGNIYIKWWWYFRSQMVNKKDITMFVIYDMTYKTYKHIARERSPFWEKFFSTKYIWFTANIFLYFFVYIKEIKLFWKTITNLKPKYLVNTRDEIIEEITYKIQYWNKVEIEVNSNEVLINKKPIYFKKSKEWKSKVESIFLLIFDSLKHYKTNKINFTLLEDFYNKDRNKYIWLDNIKVFEYESFRRTIEAKNKSIRKEHYVIDLIGISKRWIECDYYYKERK